jgi:hypothetical protein
MEIKRNNFINTAFLQTRGEKIKINWRTTLADISVRYSIQSILNCKYPYPKTPKDMT